MKNLNDLPADLPVPTDDGACNHLTDFTFPDIKLKTTLDRTIDFTFYKKSCVIFFYPRTGEADKPTPSGWDLIPGARGCTPQSCGYRDLHTEFKNLGFDVFGASTQTTQYQKEFVSRMHIPFEILSDENFELTTILSLPTFNFNGERLIKRLALVIENQKITKFFYPVFPPNENASQVLAWLTHRARFTVRTATTQDAAAIGIVHTESWKTTYKGIIDQKFLDSINLEQRQLGALNRINNIKTDCLVIVENKTNKIIGFSEVGPCREKNVDADGELYAIYLLNEFQGLGAGKILFETCIAATRKKGYSKMMVSTFEKNTISRKFYEKMNGTYIGTDHVDVDEHRHITSTYIWSLT